MMNILKIVRSLIVFIVVVVVLLLVGEGVLAIAHKTTQNPKLGTLAKLDYPSNPDEYLKIAVFGGSSSAGYNVERGFADVIRHDVGEKVGSKQLYIKNYAQNGSRFHRQQAEVLKNVIDYYDVFLIYAGNNEAHNYLDDVGYFRTKEYKGKKFDAVSKTGFETDLMTQLTYKSRIFSLTMKVAGKLKQRSKTKDALPPRIVKYENHKPYEKSKALPPEELAKLSNNFGKDLDKIAALVEGTNKHVIVSSVPTNGSYKPLFSVMGKLTPQQRKVFDQEFNAGLQNYHGGTYAEAVTRFLAANEIDDNVAILNYFLGDSLYKLGEKAKALEYFKRSIDNDGLPLRSIGSLHSIAQITARKYDNLHYVDSEQAFIALLERGATYDELFNDFHHPSILGHVIIAKEFMCAMNSIPIAQIEGACINLQIINHKELANRYKNLLNVTDEEAKRNTFMLARWHYSIGNISAYPNDYMKIAEKHINAYYESTEKSSNDQAVLYLYRSVIEGKKGNKQASIDYANQALKLSSSMVLGALKGKSGYLPAEDTWQYAFEDFGIKYSEKHKQFVINEGS